MSTFKWIHVISAVLLISMSGCTASEPPGEVLVQQEEVVVVEPPPPPPPSPPPLQLIFTGDIMLARTPGEAVAAGVDPFESLGWVLNQADLAVGNLECVVATTGEKVAKAYNFRCHPRIVPLLKTYFDAVSVANNHSGDYGPDAFAEQLDLLHAGGLPYFGGGRNLKEAHSPLILERRSMRIALLGYNEVELRSFAAASDRPGLAWSDNQQVVADIRAAAEKADLVVVYAHWGLEYHAEPSTRQRELARTMIDAGAHLVVGAHPHVVQTVDYYKGRLIIYSLGNFVFDDFLDVPPALNEPARLSWVLRVSVNQNGSLFWDTLAARTDDNGIPRLLSGVQSPCGDSNSNEIRQCEQE